MLIQKCDKCKINPIRHTCTACGRRYCMICEAKFNKICEKCKQSFGQKRPIHKNMVPPKNIDDYFSY